MAVERNGVGGLVLSHLQNRERYDRLYCYTDGKPGYPNHGNTRPPLLDHMAACFAAAPEMIGSPQLLREMRSFVRGAKGRPEAGSGAHDDCVLAWALALKVREETRSPGGEAGEMRLAALK